MSGVIVGSLCLLGLAGGALVLIAVCLSRRCVEAVPDCEVTDSERRLQEAIRELAKLEMELEIAEDLGQDAIMLNDLASLIRQTQSEVDELAAAVSASQA